MPLNRSVVAAAALFLAGNPVHGYYEGNSTAKLDRFAFGSCNDQAKHQMLWPVITAKHPQLWLWLGDNIYGDIRVWDTATLSKGVFRPAPPDVLAAKYKQQLAHPDYSRFRQTFPIIGIWDDHDYGINDGDNRYQYRKESQQLFLDFLDEPKNSPRRHQEGIYTSYTYGSGVTSVKFILLDNRYHRDPYGTEFGDFLGQAQWTWLEHELMTSTATFNIVAAGIQVLPDDRWHKIGESWSKFPKARARLLSLIQSSRASGVILLSGDVHFAEINQVRCGDAYNLTEISSSGMTHAWKLMRGVIGPAFTLANMILPWHFRVDPHQYYGSYNFGDVVFDWSKSPPTAAASVYGKDGLLKLQQVVQADRYSGDGPVACGPIHTVYPTYFLFLRVFVVAVILAFIASVLVNAIVLVFVPLQLVWRLFAFLRHPKLKSC